MYHISILFETFIVFILMLFVHVYYTIISFSWQIIITTILFIGITFVIYLMSRTWRCFLKTIFFYISYSILFFSFLRVDCIYNRLFYNNWSVWNFLSFIFEINTKIIWCYICLIIPFYRQKRNIFNVSVNIYFWGFFYHGNFIR